MDRPLLEAIATELQVEPDALVPGAELSSFALWDSLTRLSIMVILSDSTGVPVEPSELAKLKTVGDIEALLRSKRP